MTYWLYITNTENWGVISRENLVGLPKKKMKMISKIKTTDKLVVYTTKGYHNPSAIVAICEILSEPYEDNTALFSPVKTNTIFPIRIKIKVVKLFTTPIIFTDILRKLEFIKNKINWGSNLQGKSLIKLSDTDFNFLNNFD